MSDPGELDFSAVKSCFKFFHILFLFDPMEENCKKKEYNISLYLPQGEGIGIVLTTMFCVFSQQSSVYLTD